MESQEFDLEPGLETPPHRAATDPEPLRLVYADDEERYRLLLGAVLRTYPQFEVVGVAENGEEAVALALEHRPAVVLLDVHMPLLDGMEAARRITEQVPGARIVLHTGEIHEDRRSEARALGLALVDKLAIHETLTNLL